MQDFELFKNESVNNVNRVENAIKHGALLSKEELFDYNFKYLLSYKESYRRVIKDKYYRRALFFAKSVLLLEETKLTGYNNEDIINTFKQISYWGLMYCGEFSLINGSDWNGDMFIDVLHRSKKYSLKMNSVEDFTSSVLYFVKELAVKGIKDEEMVKFLSNYLSFVYECILNCIKPIPYVDSNVKTLKQTIKTKQKSGNCVYVDFIGGNNGRRDESKSSAYGGV